MVFLVVVTHVAVGYERYSMGAEWWIVVDPSNNDFAGILFLILDIFVMAVIFFISGYFAPMSLDRNSVIGFVKSKFRRLMVPWIFAVLTLLPAYKIIFLYSRGLPQEYWTEYFHWNSLWSQNWLWFLPVLFTFNVLYLLIHRLGSSKAGFIKSVMIAFLAGLAYSFLMDYYEWQGWTKSVLIDFQNERVFIYLLVFLTGAISYKHRLFVEGKRNKKLEIIAHSIGWIPVNLYLAGIIYGLIKPDQYLFSKAMDVFLLRLSFMLSLIYFIYTLLITFRNYADKNGVVWRHLNKNSYGVYIIHVIVMGLMALVFRGMGIPSLVKFFSLVLSSYLISNFFVYLYDQIKSKIFG